MHAMWLKISWRFVNECGVKIQNHHPHLITMSKEWSRQGSFQAKPAAGWLHPDQDLISTTGVYYPAR